MTVGSRLGACDGDVDRLGEALDGEMDGAAVGLSLGISKGGVEGVSLGPADG
jgi:hypothetical protein